jgi:signal transduction histidine kinase
VTIASAVVSVALLATVAIHPHDPFGGRQLVDGFLLAAYVAVAAVAFIRHRGTRDPQALLVGTGFAILAVQTLLFAGYSAAAGRADDPAWEGRPLPSLGWQWAWLLASVCFLLALPWWERRGRAPIRLGTVARWATIALLLGDVALALGRKGFGTVTVTSLGDDAPFAHATWLHWLLAILAVGALLAAGQRERRAGAGITSSHTWLGAAWIPAAAAQIVYLAWPVQFRPLLVPGAGLPALAAALAFAGFLVSERVEVTQMRRATDRAQEMMGGRAEIASMIAHELRGPVSTIKGLATTGAHHFDALPDADLKEFFGLIDRESRRLLRIVDETSLALKIDAGTLTYDIRPENLSVAVTDGANKADAGDHPLRIDADEHIRLPIDRLRITETVSELVNNAARFSPDGAPIQVLARREGDRGVIEVLDRGAGIAPEHRPGAFEKFAHFRPKGYEEVPGTGLGLFICRAHVQAHGGRITVEEGPEGGTMLAISLPMEGSG